MNHAPAESGSPPKYPLDPTASIRILVVDDDPAIREFVETLLAKDGFSVKTLGNPAEVEAEIRVGGYHLVILDLMMPETSGLDVLRGIRKIDSDIAVIIFTGFPDVESAVEAMKLDAVDYLKKPFQVEELRGAVDRVMRKKGLVRTPIEQVYRVIGAAIRTMRTDKNLTLKDMGRRTGLSVSLLSQIERAESAASIESLYKIAIALDAKLCDLFGDF